MKTHPVTTKDGMRSFAFEIDVACISPGKAARLLTEVDGVTDVRLRKMFSNSADVHIEFKYRGQPYQVWEPFGDNSRFWTGPRDAENDVGDITGLEAAFKRYRPPIHRVLLGRFFDLD